MGNKGFKKCKSNGRSDIKNKKILVVFRNEKKVKFTRKWYSLNQLKIKI